MILDFFYVIEKILDMIYRAGRSSQKVSQDEAFSFRVPFPMHRLHAERVWKTDYG